MVVVAGGGYWHNLAVALFPFVANSTVACVTNLTFIFIAQFDWFDLEFQLGFELIGGIVCWDIQVKSIYLIILLFNSGYSARI